MLKKLVTLGAIVALMIAMIAPIAGAKPGGNGDGHGNGKAYGLDRQEICHKGKKTLYLPAPAIKAHLNHGDSLGECPEEPPEPLVVCNLENSVAGLDVTVEKGEGNTSEDVVEIGDELLISGDFELAEGETVSVTVRDEDGTEATFTDSGDAQTDNADITYENGSLRITVTGEPVIVEAGENGLNTSGLEGVSSDGIACTEEEDEGTIDTSGAGGAGDSSVLEAAYERSFTPPGLAKKVQKQEAWLLKSSKKR